VKNLARIIGSIVPLPFLISQAFATTPAAGDTVQLCPTGGSFANLCNKTASAGAFSNIIGTFITFAFVIAIVIALGYLVYGGIKWILSEGDKGKVEESRNHVIAAVIGLIVVFLSYFILNLVVGLFLGQGTTLNSLQLPTIGQ
jgi:hypothetical protein